MKIVITGGTGFLGRRLIRRILDEGQDTVLVLTRDPERARSSFAPAVALAGWDPLAGPPPAGVLDGAGAAIHLAGESVGQRWTPAVKGRIRESRVASTRNLVAGILEAREKPRALVSGSAAGYYGSRGDDPLDESAPAGKGFLAEVCRDWEAEAFRAAEAGVRVVQVRLGIVLGPGGGALARMLPAFKAFLGGPLGNGRQWMPWIHIDDAVGILLRAARDASLSGPVNVTAPEPVRNIDFARTLGRILGRPAMLPAPAPALRLLLGELSSALLEGQRLLPRKVEASGYKFRFPRLEEALRDALSR